LNFIEFYDSLEETEFKIKNNSEFKIKKKIFFKKKN